VFNAGAHELSHGSSQADALREMLTRNSAIGAIVERASELDLPAWYLGAGCIAQTAWNVLSGFPPGQHIGDYDLVYYDGADLSASGEARRRDAALECFRDLGVRVDVKNEARVHLWYEARFGYAIHQYRSCEDAIDSWPTTATALGIRGLTGDCGLYAPFGLSDLLAMVIRPNRRQITEAIYRDKVQRWTACWPLLTVVEW